MRRIGIIVLALLVVSAGVAALYQVTLTGGSQAPVPYSQFLADVSTGRVTSVTQDGEIVSYTMGGATIETVVPSVLTDVTSELSTAAAEGGFAPPTYTKGATPDTSWVGLIVAGSLPVIALAVLIAAGVAWLATRRARGGGTGGRLRILDDAFRAGLLTPDEYDRKRRQVVENP